MLEILRGVPPEAYTGGGLAVLVLYAVWRRLRQDLFADRRDSAEDRFRQDLIDQNKLLLDRCDRFAGERNIAQQDLAVAVAEVERLRKENDALRQQQSALAVAGGEI